jgi:hypothetical protein
MATILGLIIIVIVIAIIIYIVFYRNKEGLMITGYNKDGKPKNMDEYFQEKYTDKNEYNPVSEDSKLNIEMKEQQEDRNAPLKASDLLPKPCMGKNKDWTNTFSECENLIGGRNFVHLEDEHFTNEVLDTRCTKYMSHDLRKTPSIQYEDVSIWNKPSVCKNPYDYIRPGLDSD